MPNPKKIVETLKSVFFPLSPEDQVPLFQEETTVTPNGERQTKIETSDGKIFFLYQLSLSDRAGQPLFAFFEGPREDNRLHPAVRPEGWNVVLTPKTGHPILKKGSVPAQVQSTVEVPKRVGK